MQFPTAVLVIVSFGFGLLELSGSHLFVTALKRRPVGQQFSPVKPAAEPEPPDCPADEPSRHMHWPLFFTNDVGSEGSQRGGGSHDNEAWLHCLPGLQHPAVFPPGVPGSHTEVGTHVFQSVAYT